MRSEAVRWPDGLRSIAARAQMDRQDSALALLTAIRDSTPPRYLAVRSAAAQYQGYVYDSRADYVHLLAAYDSAVAENRTTREPQITLRVASWLALAEDELRGREAGWRTRYAALAASPRYPAVYRSLYSVFDYAGMATANEAPRLSLRYCDETSESRAQMKIRDVRSSYALRRRAEMLATMGRNGWPVPTSTRHSMPRTHD